MKYAILSDKVGQYISHLTFARNGQENVHGCNEFDLAIHYTFAEAEEVIAGLGKSYTAVSEDEAKAIARESEANS